MAHRCVAHPARRGLVLKKTLQTNRAQQKLRGTEPASGQENQNWRPNISNLSCLRAHMQGLTPSKRRALVVAWSRRNIPKLLSELRFHVGPAETHIKFCSIMVSLEPRHFEWRTQSEHPGHPAGEKCCKHYIYWQLVTHALKKSFWHRHRCYVVWCILAQTLCANL